MENNILFVCLFGMGTVFVGLVALIFLTVLMGKILNGSSKKEEKVAEKNIQSVSAIPEPVVQKDLQLATAVIIAVLTEELKYDISAENIVSIKTIG